MDVIVVAAVALVRPDGFLITVRKRGTTMFMLPGGKPEPGETSIDCAAREIHEELGIALDSTALTLLGSVDAPAANEAGAVVRATVFTHPAPALLPEPRAEIVEVRWVDPHQGINDEREAPLNRLVVFPSLVSDATRRLSVEVPGTRHP